LVSRNKPKQTRNRSCFGLFQFEPKFIFVCFEDTLVLHHLMRVSSYFINSFYGVYPKLGGRAHPYQKKK
jgi:hypothetical protein